MLPCDYVYNHGVAIENVMKYAGTQGIPITQAFPHLLRLENGDKGPIIAVIASFSTPLDIISKYKYCITYSCKNIIWAWTHHPTTQMKHVHVWFNIIFTVSDNALRDHSEFPIGWWMGSLI